MASPADYEDKLVYFEGKVNVVMQNDEFTEFILEVPHAVEGDGLVCLKYADPPNPITEGDTIQFVAEMEGLWIDTEMPELSVRALEVTALVSGE